MYMEVTIYLLYSIDFAKITEVFVVRSIIRYNINKPQYVARLRNFHLENH